MFLDNYWLFIFAVREDIWISTDQTSLSSQGQQANFFIFCDPALYLGFNIPKELPDGE